MIVPLRKTSEKKEIMLPQEVPFMAENDASNLTSTPRFSIGPSEAAG